MGGIKCFLEKAFRSLSIGGSASMELQGVPAGVHCTVEVYPNSFHLHRGLIYPPGIGRHLEVGTAALLHLRGIPPDPAVDGRMVNRETSLL